MNILADASTFSAYGLWPLLILNAPVFIIFAFSFTRPHTAALPRCCSLQQLR